MVIVSFVWRLITIRELSCVLKKNLIVIRELIVALYVWFWYLKIDYHPLVGLPKKKSITICRKRNYIAHAYTSSIRENI